MQIPPLPPLRDGPLVSVLIVNFNYAAFLPKAIESALHQSYRNLEVIICDDGSTDDSRPVIERYATRDTRIKPIFKTNARVAAALNDAFAASSGEVIALLDADDEFHAEKLSRVLDAFRKKPLAGLVMDTMLKIDAQDRHIGRLPELGMFDRGDLRVDILRSAGQFFAAPTSALSMRRQCASYVFPIPEKEFQTEADAYMRTVAALFYPVTVLDQPLTSYRIHGSNVTASSSVSLAWCERALSSQERVYAVVRDQAQRYGWAGVGEITDNGDYCEIAVVRACLSGEPQATRMLLLRQLNRAVARLKTADAARMRSKARALTLAALLPRRLSQRLLNQIYLPSGLKRLAQGKIGFR